MSDLSALTAEELAEKIRPLVGRDAPIDTDDISFSALAELVSRLHTYEDTVCEACDDMEKNALRFYEEKEALAARLHTYENALEAADWYVRCLEDVQDRRQVRGLAEAKAGYDFAREALREGKP